MILIEEVACRFKQIPKVATIYLEKSPAELVFFCFLDHDQYDDHMMDQLLDLEWELRKDFPDQIFDIHYMPLMVKDKGILSASAQKII
jgi:hypothetical protein